MKLKAEYVSLFALAALGLTLSGAMTGAYLQNQGQSTQSRDTDTTPTSESSERRFTKEEFDKFVYGKTKEEIRSEFGSPQSVQDSDDSWVYGNLPIYDQYAGTQSMVRIIFEGFPDSSDKVSSTRFF